MFPTLFRHFHPARQPWFHAFDDANRPLETTIAVSRDGRHWDRVDRRSYVPMGRNDETIFVELRDLNNMPLPGYTLGDCEEICCDDVAWKVHWRGRGDVSVLAGRPSKMHFKMRRAKSYGFQFVE